MGAECFSRRQLFAAAGATLSAKVIASNTAAGKASFKYCFNTSTIRGQKLPFDKEIEIADEAGYDCIEPWVEKINQYVENGGNLNELRKRIADLGLTVESAISFFRWIVDDDAERAKGLEQVKREMDKLAQIGGKRIAAPPAGATDKEGLDLTKAAERYRLLLEIGDQIGVVPQIEIWGSSKNLHRLGEAMFVVIESGHPKACLLPDVFHIYKGGSDFNGLKQISRQAIQVFHLNDYPADPPRDRISDRDRIFPGDGIAPLTQILRDLVNNGSQSFDSFQSLRMVSGVEPAVLSLELFNPAYWNQDPLTVAKTGLAKMKAAVARASSP